VEPRNQWLPAQVKAGAFYGHFNSGLVLGLDGFFPLAMDLHTWALYDELVCLPLIGGNNLESIMFISPVADL
jgi:hypothetical protein